MLKLTSSNLKYFVILELCTDINKLNQVSLLPFTYDAFVCKSDGNRLTTAKKGEKGKRKYRMVLDVIYIEISWLGDAYIQGSKRIGGLGTCTHFLRESDGSSLQ